MPNASPAFAFPVPTEPLVLTAGRDLAATLAARQIVSRTVLNTVMAEHFGGSDAAGRWSVRDAHAALELAQVLLLHGAASLTGDMPTNVAERVFDRLEALVPSQTTRSDEQIEWQQFATPPRLAWIAARACALSAGDQMLEPSAGTGTLAVWASKAGARLALNEISPLRRECLQALFSAEPVTGHDGEVILVRKLRKPGQFVAINYGRAGVRSTESTTLTLAADNRGSTRDFRADWC